jgi:hypothetical protein
LLTIIIRFEGFECDNTMVDNLNDINTARYVDLLQSSRYTYLFSAQKIAMHLKALITVDFMTQHSQQLTIVIPREIESSMDTGESTT